MALGIRVPDHYTHVISPARDALSLVPIEGLTHLEREILESESEHLRGGHHTAGRRHNKY